MKKKFLLAISVLVAFSAAAEIYNYITIKQGDKVLSIPIDNVESVTFTVDDQTTEPEYDLRVLTFEDKDYVGSGNFLGKSDWSSLIDSEQYMGALLYAGGAGEIYRWYDEGNTELCASFDPDGDNMYWNGGEALSNYVNADYATSVIDYTAQLAAPIGGHNGSKNFCVHNGFFDGVFYTAPRGGIWFKDGVARVVDHMFVCLTSYALSAGLVPGAFTQPATETDWVKLVAIGTDADGNTKELSLTMCENGKFVETWKKWDLSSLGEIVRLDFNITSSMANEYGMSFTGYFAYDDIAVRF